jgi:hypothetical protein
LKRRQARGFRTVFAGFAFPNDVGDLVVSSISVAGHNVVMSRQGSRVEERCSGSATQSNQNIRLVEKQDEREHKQ